MADQFQFNIVESLGKGSFAEVFKVTSKEDQKTYALKMIELKGKFITFDAVLREINFMREIDHPHIVKFIDCFETEKTDLCLKFYIQMEYCELGDMDSFITKRKGRRFRSQTIQKWMMEMSSAIGYVHSKSIIHRDLKPGNVFLDKHTNIKIGDFGVARDVLNSLADTKIGTTLFMAPETFHGKYFIEADIYSLGCIFICIAATSRVPKTETGQFVLLPPNISYGKKKADLITRCVNSDKTKRPTAYEVFNELQNDDYEMLCFHEVRSANTLSSVNKLVAGRKQGEELNAFVFSNRPLNVEEKFCLQLQRVRSGAESSHLIFGMVATDPKYLEGELPKSVRDLRMCSECYACFIELPLVQGNTFTFWYSEDGTIKCDYDGRLLTLTQKTPCSTELWAFFDIYEDIQQVQLRDYEGPN